MTQWSLQPFLKGPLKQLFVWSLILASLGTGYAVTPSGSGQPIQLGVQSQSLDLTDDISMAEAQVNAYPENAEAAFLLALAYSRTPQLEKALETLKRAKSLLKKDPQGYQLLENKIQEYEGMLAYRPSDTRVLYRLAFGYYMKAYAMQHYPNSQSVWPNASLASQYLDKAENTLQQVIQLDPHDIWSRNYYGYLIAERNENRLDEAVHVWENSLVVNPNNPGAYILLGEAYLKQGDLKKAVEYASKGLQARAVLGLSPLGSKEKLTR